MKFLSAALPLFLAAPLWAQTPALESLKTFEKEVETLAASEKPISPAQFGASQGVWEIQKSLESGQYVRALGEVEALLKTEKNADTQRKLGWQRDALNLLKGGELNVFGFRMLFLHGAPSGALNRATPILRALQLKAKPLERWQLVADLLADRARQNPRQISPGLWLIADALPDLGARAETTASGLTDGALWLQKAGKNDQAILRLKRVQTEFGSILQGEHAIYLLGEAAREKGNWKEAESLFLTIIKAFDARNSVGKKERRGGTMAQPSATALSLVYEATNDLPGALSWAKLAHEKYFVSSMCGTCDGAIRFRTQKRIEELEKKIS